ncbi:MAG TPA: endolytic transglycosylase MltG [Candidatus Paceibacterota bacterium]|nr:endolytic transglycosylase MltG [Candidatus Paceibacterota bacterium]
MNKKYFTKNSLFIIICILVLFFYTSVNLPLTCQEECDFSITKGENLRSIANRLRNEKYISSSILFQVYVKTKGLEKNIKAGDYQFIPPLTITNITEIITNGKLTQNNNSFLILEGETMLEIEENLKEKGLIDPSSSLKDWKIGDFLEKRYLDIFSEFPPNTSLEGYLFPDSYHLPQGLEEKEILSMFIDNFVSKIENDLFFDIKEQKRSFYEILIMASLLEKEVREETDKRMVADILWRRLDTNFPLQIDATICYAEFQSFKNCSLTRELFELDSPYNTYLYKGLPPTPINNPGIESIQAALDPISNDYWYYMTDRKTGKTIFSETFEEHSKARQKYL